MNKKADLFLEYEFNAPKKIVFNAFSDEEALSEWWGPVDYKTTVLKLDFREKGIFHYKMENGETVNYGRFVFGKIQPYDILEFTNSFTDEKANIIRAPFDNNLPLEIFYKLSFIEKNKKTTISMTGQAINASKEECQAFKSMNAGVKKGFSATFERLVIYLNKK